MTASLVLEQGIFAACTCEYTGSPHTVLSDLDAWHARCEHDVFIALFSAGVPDATPAVTVTKMPGKSVLHCEGMNTVCAWHAAIRKLQELFGFDAGVCVSCFSRASSDADEKTLDSMFGGAVHTNAADWQRATRLRAWRSSPALLEGVLPPLRVPPAKCAQHLLYDGSVWHPDSTTTETTTVPCALRADWPDLVQRASAGTPLGATDVATVQSLKIMKGNEVHFAGVPFFLDFLGLSGTPLQSILEQFPCTNSFDIRDGFSIATTHDVSTVCGKQRFCGPCATALRILGNSWEKNSRTEVLVRVLHAAVQFWNGVDMESSFWVSAAVEHQCSSQCSLAP